MTAFKSRQDGRQDGRRDGRREGRHEGPPRNRSFGEERPRHRGPITFTGLDPRDTEALRRFMTEHGKIVPARLTGLPAKQQRRIKRVIRRARVVGIVP